MPLTAGTILSSYEILAPLGAGGMGEVWRARDTRLGREVAIKALPEAFMRDAVAKGLAERAAILPSICLVRSPSALRFIDEKVPGITVPAEVIERCERAADPEAECFEVACELADAARALPGVRGLHLISFRREAGIARLCRRLGIPTRNEREMSGYRRPVAV